MLSTKVAGRIAATAADTPGAQPASPTSAWSRQAAFDAARTAYALAARQNGTVEQSFLVAGRPIHAAFAGPALIPAMTSALTHLAVGAQSDADLSVMLWDSASTGIAFPVRPGAGLHSPDSRDVAGRADRVRYAYQREARILTLYDAALREAIVWVPDARSVPSNEVASPLRTLLHWWARDHGLQFAHAGAVGLDGKAVLLAGPSGAGKSTSALACLLAGLDYLGDDYVLVDAKGGTTIHSLYSAAKLQPNQVAAFPELTGLLDNPDKLATEKALWFVDRDFPDRTRSSAEAVAVVVPRITGGTESSLEPIKRSTALAALAPSTLAQLAGADQWALNALATFLGSVSAFRLSAGTDLPGLAHVVRELLEGRHE